MLASSPNPTLTLADFLALPHIDDSPAWEYVNGTIAQKPMPKTFHSRLQLKLASMIDLAGESNKNVLAFTQLRCNLTERSIVPDIVVLGWEHLPINDSGELENQAISFSFAPDWVIEILSPQQSLAKVMKNILYCLDQGSELGWLINPEERSILVLLSQQAPQCYLSDDPEINNGQEILPVLSGLDLKLTTEKIFSWLEFSR
ncbi:Uma2 family endonuclease [Synechocystis sp. PCC 7338]|uniref:Uma2 family endonuclease n=1 Tax=Synechocystis sp. PCC 7338 TaxID=2732530 RepID=UPI001BF0E1D7|nr:Uma2 family endonuclease [Synechocystis sp. PCC 7338]QUS60651.1 Uma2 family endonuclease [Synechocystis sp. PCC 7338]